VGCTGPLLGAHLSAWPACEPATCAAGSTQA
jgi:hypothetical protein